MTATTPRTTTSPRSGSRSASSCHRNARPAKRIAGSKTAPRNFFAAPPKTHPETATQSLGTYLESVTYVYDFASGCAVAPNSTATTSTTNSGHSDYYNLVMGLSVNPGLAASPSSQELTDPTYAQQMMRHGDRVGGAVVIGTAGAVLIGGEIAAVAAPVAPFLPRISDTLFARGNGLLNSNDYVRLGFGWSGSATAGNPVFRFVLGSEGKAIYWHVFEFNVTKK